VQIFGGRGYMRENVAERFYREVRVDRIWEGTSEVQRNIVADRAVQIFGGRGYMRENVAERFWREVRVDRIWEGTSEIQRNIVADQLAKRGVRMLSG